MGEADATRGRATWVLACMVSAVLGCGLEGAGSTADVVVDTDARGAAGGVDTDARASAGNDGAADTDARPHGGTDAGGNAAAPLDDPASANDEARPAVDGGADASDGDVPEEVPGGADASDGDVPEEVPGGDGLGTLSQDAAERCASIEASPCGGDIIGTWLETTKCYATADGGNSSVSIDSCGARFSVDLDASNVTVTRTFRADGTYRMTETGTRVATLELPKRCYPIDCDPSVLAGDGELLRPVEDTGGACIATTRTSLAQGNSGTWNTVGSQVVLDVESSVQTLPDGSARFLGPFTSSGDYCVDDDHLSLATDAAEPGSLSRTEMVRIDNPPSAGQILFDHEQTVQACAAIAELAGGTTECAECVCRPETRGAAGCRQEALECGSDRNPRFAEACLGVIECLFRTQCTGPDCFAEDSCKSELEVATNGSLGDCLYPAHNACGVAGAYLGCAQERCADACATHVTFFTQ